MAHPPWPWPPVHKCLLPAARPPPRPDPRRHRSTHAQNIGLQSCLAGQLPGEGVGGSAIGQPADPYHMPKMPVTVGPGFAVGVETLFLQFTDQEVGILGNLEAAQLYGEQTRASGALRRCRIIVFRRRRGGRQGGDLDRRRHRRLLGGGCRRVRGLRVGRRRRRRGRFRLGRCDRGLDHRGGGDRNRSSRWFGRASRWWCWL